MARLRIVADRNVSYVEAAFAHLGTVTALPAAAIDRDAVRDADLLLVRSATRVDAALLADSPVRFVGTATIGTDHLDLTWLRSRGIHVASAPGSNARSVALWWAAAMLAVADRAGIRLAGRSAGIIGAGHVGSYVERVARALGMEVLRCDPPRARAEGGAGFTSLDDLLVASDVVSLHVPLTEEGPDRTRALLSTAHLALLRPGAWLCNASRGAVLDGHAAADAVLAGRLGALVLDVFDPEPAIPPAVAAACDLATPHIAGHSLDGKAAGTKRVYDAACAFLGERPRWTPGASLPPPPAAAITLDARDLDDEAAARALVRRFYRIERDDDALRGAAAIADPIARGRAFQAHRDNYPAHREPIDVRIGTIPPRPRALALLAALGAHIEATPAQDEP